MAPELGINGLDENFYRDWLKRSNKMHPRLGIDSMLSETSKIGDEARSFGLPLEDTCCNGLGIATACRHYCYVHKSREGRAAIEERYKKNFEIARRPDFDKLVTGAIHKANTRFVKLHVSGDFFSVEYIRAWIIVVLRCPLVAFWIYTRAWRVKRFLPALVDLAGQANVRMWFSHDSTSGEPPVVPGIRRAWLSFHDDAPDAASDLVFRASYERKLLVTPEIGGVRVCPHYSGKERFPADCVTCGYCLPSKKEVK